MRFGVALLAALALAPSAGAAGPARRFRLTYSRGPAAQTCPDASLVMSAVAVQLGYVPWEPEAADAIAVEIVRNEAGLRARVELRQGDKLAGSRVLSSAESDCQELSEAVALAIAIAIDPLNTRLAGPAPRPRPSQQYDREVSAELRASQPAPPPSPASPEHRPYGLLASVGGLAAVGSAPAVAGGLELQLALRWRRFSALVEGRLDLPAEKEVELGLVRSSLMLGAVGSCAHWRWAQGCGLIEAGAMRVTGEGYAEENVTLPYAGAALRLGLEIPLFSVISVRGHADLLAPFTRVAFRDRASRDTVWTAPSVAGAFGLCVVVQIL